MKKVLSLILCALLLLPAAACGRGSAGAEAQPAQTEAVSAAAAEAAPAAQTEAEAQPEETEAEAQPEETAAEHAAAPIEIAVRRFHKYGNVILDTSFEALQAQNIELTDIITVFIGEQSYDMPVGTQFSDVDSGSMICRFDTEDDEVALAINSGSFAETVGMAVRETVAEEPGYRWDIMTDTVRIVLTEKGGYSDEYTLRHLARTNERADYSALSDAEFANCRAVTAAGVKEHMLYRGSTPLDTDLGRDTCAMAFLRENGIRSILNLTDTANGMTAYETYAGSYYADCTVWNAEMRFDYLSEEFAGKVRDCVRFLLENDGPFYIHCKEGKDRTGILCAIAECALGAPWQAVADDYMLTYRWYYGLEEGNEAYDAVLRAGLTDTLCALFEVDDLTQAELRAEAEDYLRAAGLTAEELSAFSERFGA